MNKILPMKYLIYFHFLLDKIRIPGLPDRQLDMVHINRYMSHNKPNIRITSS